MNFLSVTLALLLAWPGSARGPELLRETFAKPGLVAGPKAASPTWEAEAGELRSKKGTAWTNSRVLRLFTRRGDFKDVSVTFDLLTRGLEAGGEALERAWDGVHLWLRYHSEQSHYFASLNRRDGTVVIKKQSAGGLHTISAQAPYEVPYNAWQSVRATVSDNPDGSVSIALFMGDQMIVSAVDDGSQGGPPLRDAGRVGLRGDNAELHLARFAVAAFEARLPKIKASSATVRGGEAVITWSTDIPAGAEVEYGPTPEMGGIAAGIWGLTHAVTLGGLEKSTKYYYKVRARAGPGGAMVEGERGEFTTASTVDVSSPTVMFDALPMGLAPGAGIPVTAQASDDSGVAGVQFLLDGVPLGAEAAAPPYGLVIDPQRYSPGSHTLSAVVRDAAGNRSEITMPIELASPNVSSAFSVQPGEAAPSAASSSAGSAVPAFGAADGVRAAEKFLSPALADGINDAARFGPRAAEIAVFDVRGREVYHARKSGGASLSWNGRDPSGRLVESGVYVVKIGKEGGGSVFQSLAVVK